MSDRHSGSRGGGSARDGGRGRGHGGRGSEKDHHHVSKESTDVAAGGGKRGERVPKAHTGARGKHILDVNGANKMVVTEEIRHELTMTAKQFASWTHGENMDGAYYTHPAITEASLMAGASAELLTSIGIPEAEFKKNQLEATRTERLSSSSSQSSRASSLPSWTRR